jgi:hypothetical protein
MQFVPPRPKVQSLLYLAAGRYGNVCYGTLHRAALASIGLKSVTTPLVQ